jgi:hypothetical protein
VQNARANRHTTLSGTFLTYKVLLKRTLVPVMAGVAMQAGDGCCMKEARGGGGGAKERDREASRMQDARGV